MGLRHYKIGLQSLKSGKSISDAGGACKVVGAGTATKVALYNADGTTKANPVALVYGNIEFWTLDTIATVDLYIQAPSGHFVTEKNVAASGPNFLTIDKSQPLTVMTIPAAAVDQSADATETDSGFDLIAGSIVLPVASGLSVDILTLQAAKTLDFGTAEAIAETGGDADGMASALTLAAAAPVVSAVSSGVVVSTHVSITTTFSTGSTVAAVFLKIPVLLPAASL